MATPLNNVPPLSPEQEPLIIKLQELVATMEESKETDAARWAKADEERQAVSAQIQTLENERQTKLRDAATAKAIASISDGVVIGSRIIQELENTPRENAVQAVQTFIAGIRKALDE